MEDYFQDLKKEWESHGNAYAPFVLKMTEWEKKLFAEIDEWEKSKTTDIFIKHFQSDTEWLQQYEVKSKIWNEFSNRIPIVLQYNFYGNGRVLTVAAKRNLT